MDAKICDMCGKLIRGERGFVPQDERGVVVTIECWPDTSTTCMGDDFYLHSSYDFCAYCIRHIAKFVDMGGVPL